MFDGVHTSAKLVSRLGLKIGVVARFWLIFVFHQPTSGLQVYLSKRIPPEAGLGGGSANAATALFAANELAGHPASLEDLQLWSGELGSDITFFLSTGTCYCTGRGEILHPQKPLTQAR